MRLQILQLYSDYIVGEEDFIQENQVRSYTLVCNSATGGALLQFDMEDFECIIMNNLHCKKILAKQQVEKNQMFESQIDQIYLESNKLKQYIIDQYMERERTPHIIQKYRKIQQKKDKLISQIQQHNMYTREHMRQILSTDVQSPQILSDFEQRLQQNTEKSYMNRQQIREKMFRSPQATKKAPKGGAPSAQAMRLSDILSQFSSKQNNYYFHNKQFPVKHTSVHENLTDQLPRLEPLSSKGQNLSQMMLKKLMPNNRYLYKQVCPVAAYKEDILQVQAPGHQQMEKSKQSDEKQFQSNEVSLCHDDHPQEDSQRNNTNKYRSVSNEVAQNMRAHKQPLNSFKANHSSLMEQQRKIPGPLLRENELPSDHRHEMILRLPSISKNSSQNKLYQQQQIRYQSHVSPKGPGYGHMVFQQILAQKVNTRPSNA